MCGSELIFVAVACLIGAVVPASAQSAIGDGDSAWGIRVGFANDPDQVVGGVHFLETELANNVYLVPHAELGVGDDAVVVAGTVPVLYRFVVDAKVRPYVGGGVTIAWIDVDPPNGNGDSSFEIAIRAIGGILWRLDSGQEMFAEINLGSRDLWDIQAMVGWRF
jgi:hypothetical protein